MANDQAATKDAVHHLEEALSVADDDEVQFHLRQALQLLGLQD